MLDRFKKPDPTSPLLTVAQMTACCGKSRSEGDRDHKDRTYDKSNIISPTHINLIYFSLSSLPNIPRLTSSSMQSANSIAFCAHR